MNKFIEAQKELVKLSEIPHFEGLRHKGLSGTICEDILVKELRKAIPNLKFDRGVIKYCSTSLKGTNIHQNDLSSQIDIIIYKGEPLFQIESNAIVDINRVIGIIEVKKWSFPKMLEPNSSLANSLVRLENELEIRSGRKIPAFFVSFRFHDRVKGNVTWFSRVKDFPIKNSYCFFGRFSKMGKNLYPWEEINWEKFETSYAGEYERLVKDIEKLALNVD